MGPCHLCPYCPPRLDLALSYIGTIFSSSIMSLSINPPLSYQGWTRTFRNAPSEPKKSNSMSIEAFWRSSIYIGPWLGSLMPSSKVLPSCSFKVLLVSPRSFLLVLSRSCLCLQGPLSPINALNSSPSTIPRYSTAGLVIQPKLNTLYCSLETASPCFRVRNPSASKSRATNWTRRFHSQFQGSKISYIANHYFQCAGI